MTAVRNAVRCVCIPEDLPLSYELFSGNRVDVTTVEDIVKMIEEKHGAAERVWVMDRGMVSKANIAFVGERKAHYIVAPPKSELIHFEAALLQAENWTGALAGLDHSRIARSSSAAIATSDGTSTPVLRLAAAITRILTPCSSARSCSSDSACSSGAGGHWMNFFKNLV